MEVLYTRKTLGLQKIMKIPLTYNRLHQLLDYNPATGNFIWKESRGNVKKGDIAGTIDKHGYHVIRIDRKLYKAHRLAWLYIHGYFPEHDIDHRNRLKPVNKIENLREVSRVCNTRNSGNRKDNTSGVKGVAYVKNSNNWLVRITVMQKTYSLGNYDDYDDAVCARLAAEQCLGWSGCDSSSPAFKYVQDILNANG